MLRRVGVAASTAIHWVDRWRSTGSVRPQPQGGDFRAHHREGHADKILGLIEETPDITLAEIAAHLDEFPRFKTVPGTIWRLRDRPRISNSFSRSTIPDVSAFVGSRSFAERGRTTRP